METRLKSVQGHGAIHVEQFVLVSLIRDFKKSEAETVFVGHD